MEFLATQFGPITAGGEILICRVCLSNPFPRWLTWPNEGKKAEVNLILVGREPSGANYL